MKKKKKLIYWFITFNFTQPLPGIYFFCSSLFSWFESLENFLLVPLIRSLFYCWEGFEGFVRLFRQNANFISPDRSSCCWSFELISLNLNFCLETSGKLLLENSNFSYTLGSRQTDTTEINSWIKSSQWKSESFARKSFSSSSSKELKRKGKRWNEANHE